MRQKWISKAELYIQQTVVGLRESRQAAGGVLYVLTLPQELDSADAVILYCEANLCVRKSNLSRGCNEKGRVLLVSFFNHACK